ncbi:carbonic anhydrase 15 isoform X2 [Hemibagrus wyckioides]|uniref:carbonic anhydrase 15 isoform X2 n=1 Tax=Hemibagrus wyckioides TaxID=337641 RepID=UPI00266BB0E8|nr:carbonic anhydrase 15 isoform X2 [Hemibagrus wyckioides]XP_058245785.1 carbonic anhydrase 15 isoform X2 [Hemibagrus wyckioides]
MHAVSPNVFFFYPYQWVKTFPSCIIKQSTLHSPIVLEHVATKNNSISPLGLQRFNMRQGNWTVANVRNTVVVTFQAGMSVKGGSIKHNYQIVEMRFHWGTNVTNGSEHKLDSRRFPMEMQIVGLAPGFTDVEAASAVPSGLLMMGVFIDIASAENEAFKAIAHAVSSVPYPGDSVSVTPPALLDLLPDNYKFYQYHGGLTTPPCFQTVTWIVFEKPIFISREQYLPFVTHLYYSDKNDTVKKLLVENYRFTQPSFNRQIIVSYAVPNTASLSQPALISILILTSIVSLMCISQL